MNKIYQKTKEKIKQYTFLYTVLINIRTYVIYFINKICNYRLEKMRFYKELGYELNLKDPKSFNEKIVWKKIHDRNPLLPITTDKYQVRSYIKKVLGEEKAEEVLIPLLYVTDKPESIPFEKLPSAFIVKPNHASGLKIMVENGHYNKEEIIKTCKRWLKTPYGTEKLEWAYHPIKRKILIERLLRESSGNIPKEFYFYMFHGKCKLVYVICDKKDNPSRSFYDEKWNYLSVKNKTLPQGAKIGKPKNYEIMLELAEKISKPFDHIRVDFYNINGMIYIGELTHYSVSGRLKFEPQSYDFLLGKYWKIEPEYWKNK
jgi:hypothetical protein